MSLRILVALISVTAVLGSNCSKPTESQLTNKKEDPPLLQSDYPYPLAVGNKWVYERHTRDLPEDDYQIDTVTWQISRLDTIDDDIWYVCDAGNCEEHWINRSDGFHVKPSGRDEYMLFKYPCDEVDGWVGPDSIYYVGRVVHSDHYVSFPPYGTHYSYGYRSIPMYSGYDDYSYTFAPGLGLRLMSMWRTESSWRFQKGWLSLIECDLANPARDTLGSISFKYYIRSDSLPDTGGEVRYDIQVTLSNPPMCRMAYHFKPGSEPEVLLSIGGMPSILEVRNLPNASAFTHDITLPVAPWGNQEVTVLLRIGGTILSEVTSTKITVAAGQTAVLDTISAFGG